MNKTEARAYRDRMCRLRLAAPRMEAALRELVAYISPKHPHADAPISGEHARVLAQARAVLADIDKENT
jgi:hypothetical protein